MTVPFDRINTLPFSKFKGRILNPIYSTRFLLKKLTSDFPVIE